MNFPEIYFVPQFFRKKIDDILSAGKECYTYIKTDCCFADCSVEMKLMREKNTTQNNRVFAVCLIVKYCELEIMAGKKYIIRQTAHWQNFLTRKKISFKKLLRKKIHRPYICGKRTCLSKMLFLLGLNLEFRLQGFEPASCC